MKKRRDQSPLYRTPLRGTIVSSPVPQSGVFNTSSSLMRTPPVDLRSGMNPFQKGKSMPRKKKEDAAYRSEKDVIRDYDPDLLVEMETYGKMAKGMSCPECGSKMRKGAMCKCGGMGKMAKGAMSKVTLPPKPGQPMPGMPPRPGQPRPPVPPRPRPPISGSQYGPDTGIMNPAPKRPIGGGMGSNIGAMGKGQGAYIDGQKAPESHPTKMSKGGKSAKSEIDKKLVMFNTRKGMMSKSKAKVDAQRWNDAAPMMSAANAKNPMVVEQMPSGAIMGRPTSAKNVGSKNSAAKKMAKAGGMNQYPSPKPRPTPGGGRVPQPMPKPRPNDKGPYRLPSGGSNPSAGSMASAMQAPVDKPIGRPNDKFSGRNPGGVSQPKPNPSPKPPPFKTKPSDPIRITDGPVIRDKFPPRTPKFPPRTPKPRPEPITGKQPGYGMMPSKGTIKPAAKMSKRRKGE